MVGASTASLIGVGFALGLAGRESDVLRGVLVIFAFCTVIVSWTVINTVFTLRYAHLHVRSRVHGIDFGPQAMHEQPTYRDFAYVAFTVGMTYQVSDTALRDPGSDRRCCSTPFWPICSASSSLPARST